MIYSTMYIYKVTNLLNNKIYVGCCVRTPEKSIDYFGSGKIIKAAIRKYGKKNFSKEILEKNIATYELLYEREIFWIKELDAKSGYNLSAGGNFNPFGGMFKKKHTADSKEKMSSKRKNVPLSQEHKNRIGESNRNKKKSLWSAERCENQSIVLTGRILADTHKENIGLQLKGKLSGEKNMQCPYCKKIGSGNAMKRWHYEKCKYAS